MKDTLTALESLDIKPGRNGSVRPDSPDREDDAGEDPGPESGQVPAEAARPAAATVHGIPRCTRFLIAGTKPIGGKKFSGFDEIEHFYRDYQGNLPEMEKAAVAQQDRIIASLEAEESALGARLGEEIDRNAAAVNGRLNELERGMYTHGKLSSRFLFLMKYQAARSMRSRTVTGNVKAIERDLERVRARKAYLTTHREQAAREDYENMAASFRFLEMNEPFLIRAGEEERVVRILSGLPAGYHILNDVNLAFRPPLRYGNGDELIPEVRLDHVVVGPTGICLVAAKNWKAADTGDRAGNLVSRGQRSCFALWTYLSGLFPGYGIPQIRSAVVFTGDDGLEEELAPGIGAVSPDRLNQFILYGPRILHAYTVREIVRLLAAGRPTG